MVWIKLNHICHQVLLLYCISSSNVYNSIVVPFEVETSPEVTDVVSMAVVGLVVVLFFVIGFVVVGGGGGLSVVIAVVFVAVGGGGVSVVVVAVGILVVVVCAVVVLAVVAKGILNVAVLEWLSSVSK